MNFCYVNNPVKLPTGFHGVSVWNFSSELIKADYKSLYSISFGLQIRMDGIRMDGDYKSEWTVSEWTVSEWTEEWTDRFSFLVALLSIK